MTIWFVLVGILAFFFVIPFLVVLILILAFAVWGVLEGFYIPIIKWILKYGKTKKRC